MRGTEFGGLTAFVAVADHGNFSKAAAALGISTSTMSHTIRVLEERLGVRLLNRTTRSVALTEAGDQLLRQIHPALDELDNAVESLGALSGTPSGVLRLAVGSLAVKMVIDPILPSFRAAYPDVVLDITIDDSQLDIVHGHFDAGMRIGSRIERDMVAVRVSSGFALDRGRIARLPRGAWPAVEAGGFARARLYPLSRHDRRDPEMGIRARRGDDRSRGRGLAHHQRSRSSRACRAERRSASPTCSKIICAPHIAAGRLVPVLEGWSLPFAGFHLFYPSRHQMPPKLRAFITFLRTDGPRRAAMRPHLATESDAA